MKDYYQILGLTPGANEEEIRRTYRRLALRHHPDRNPGDAAAEERFKEIAEAYGVLMDPVKRSQYDRYRSTASRQDAAGGFGYSQEEILRDIFSDPRFNQVFHDLFREFQRAGYRFDERFLNQTFFGGRGRIFGSIFIWEPFGPRDREQIRPQPGLRPAAERRPQGDPRLRPPEWLKRLGQKVKHFLLGGPRELPPGRPGDLDLSYDLTVSPAVAALGGKVEIVIPRNGIRETLRVTIPASTRSGTRLRLRGKGRQSGSAAGDLYLTIHLS